MDAMEAIIVLIGVSSSSPLAFLAWRVVSLVYEREEPAENQDCAGI